jgi:hypothetical protein
MVIERLQTGGKFGCQVTGICLCVETPLLGGLAQVLGDRLRFGGVEVVVLD